MKNTNIIAIAVLGLLSTNVATQAQLIGYEGFDMPGNGDFGSIGGTRGTGGGDSTWTSSDWTNGGGGWQWNSVGLSYPRLVTTPGGVTAPAGGGAGGDDQNFRSFGTLGSTNNSSTPAGVYWASFLINIVPADNSSGSVGISFFGGGERNFFGKAGVANWSSLIYLPGNLTSRIESPTPASDQTAMFLIKLVFGSTQATSRAYAFLNPDLSLGEPDISSAFNTDTVGDQGGDGMPGQSFFPNTFNRVRLGQFSMNPGAAFDEFRIGRTFADVAPTIQDPFVRGDFNFDGGVDASDIDPFVIAANEGDPFAGFINSFQAAFALLYPGQTLTPTVVNQIGDFNGDGGVDASDIDPFVVFANNGGSGLSAIPEPAALGLLAPVGLLLARRRR